MTIDVNPELCGPVVCAALVVLVLCVAANTALNVVNSIRRWDWVRWVNRDPSLR